MLLNDKVYKILKWIAQFLLPALGTLYFALATIWGLPYGEQIVGTISALTIFLGVILGISSSAYNKSSPSDGILQVDTSDPNKDTYRLQLNGDVTDLASKDKVVFTVDKNTKL